MNQRWNIIFSKGAEYQETVSVGTWPNTYPALNTATEWRLTVSQPDVAGFLVASSIGASPMITLNVAMTVATIKVPAATTAVMPLGSARYDLDIFFPSSVTKRLISLGAAQVNTKAGAV
jgi:predicted RNA polymerase sigma factor